MKQPNQMMIEELSNNYSRIPWMEYINNILSPILTLDINETIYVNEPKFLTNLENLILTTPKRVLANYALWRVVKHSINYLGNEIKNRQTQYETEAIGTTQSKPRFIKKIFLTSNNSDFY